MSVLYRLLCYAYLLIISIESSAQKNFITEKRDYYLNIGDWNNYTKYRSEELTKYPLTSNDELYIALQLNEPAWSVFLRTSDKKALERALNWSRLSINMILPKTNPEFYDTQANLLYKLGRVEEAIDVQKKALQLFVNSLTDGQVPVINNIFINLEKMKKGIPTWN
jgi:tetratricopeptide (TPR) repeat protein